MPCRELLTSLVLALCMKKSYLSYPAHCVSDIFVLVAQ